MINTARNECEAKWGFNTEHYPSIDPNRLFAKRILNFRVSTKRNGNCRYLNLDNAATTPPFCTVERAVHKFMTSYGSVHRGAGTKSKLSTAIFDKARYEIKRFVNSPETNYLLFTGNTTGAMNALSQMFSQLEGAIAVSSIEHSSSRLPWTIAEGLKEFGRQRAQDLTELNGAHERIRVLGEQNLVQYEVDRDLQICLESVDRVLAAREVKALVVTASSNLTGYIADLKQLGRIAKKHRSYFIVDACQHLQHHPVDMQELGIDFLIASGHKLYAPYGGGFVIGSKDFFDSVLPYQIGGGNLSYIANDGTVVRPFTELAHDPGTPNAVGAISMAAAVDQLSRLGMENVQSYERRLTLRALEVLASIPRVRIFIEPQYASTVIPFTIEGMRHDQIAERLNDEFGIGVRSGSFCVYHAVRKLYGIEDDTHILNDVRSGNIHTIPGVVRASFSLCNFDSDVERLVEAVVSISK